MTLIVKELVIRGIVSKDSSKERNSPMEKENLLQYLEQMQKEIEQQCVEKVLSKLQTSKKR